MNRRINTTIAVLGAQRAQDATKGPNPMITEADGPQTAETPAEAIPAEPAPDRPTRLFEGRTWASRRGASNLVLEPTNEGDEDAALWIGTPSDGPGVLLEPKHMRELAATLVRRADKLDPPDRPWKDVPRTPGEILDSFLSSARSASERTLADDETPGMTYARIMMVVDGFTVAALMAELDQLAPDRAAMVAKQLGEAYFDGGSVDEWLREWAEKRAKGEPIGFDPPATLPLGSAGAEVPRG